MNLLEKDSFIGKMIDQILSIPWVQSNPTEFFGLMIAALGLMTGVLLMTRMSHTYEDRGLESAGHK